MATVSAAPSPHAVAALALAASLLEALVKRGAIDRPGVDDMLRDAASYAQALCADCPSEVEGHVQRLLTMIGQAQAGVAETEVAAATGPAA